MPKPPSTRRIMAASQKQARLEIRQEFKMVADAVRGALLSAAGGENNPVPIERSDQAERLVRSRASNALQRMFVGADGLSPFADDGRTALAPYPLTLNKAIVRVTARHVYAHRDWMERHVPEDVYLWLANQRIQVVRQQENPFLRRQGESVEAHKARLKALRIFEPNPLAQYEEAHTWVDPRGYRLSDRIWNTSNETRRKLDEILRDGIREGIGAKRLADQVEQFLLPGRALIRTRRPYSRDGSFDAMRLARTEIARAANQAALIAARLNPYVDRVEWARSGNGDPNCKICPQHATLGTSGERLREAYPVMEAPSPPAHPHCLCHIRPVVTDSPAEVTAQLRAVMEEADALLLHPVLTPVQADSLIALLLGLVLAALLAQGE